MAARGKRKRQQDLVRRVGGAKRGPKPFAKQEDLLKLLGLVEEIHKIIVPVPLQAPTQDPNPDVAEHPYKDEDPAPEADPAPEKAAPAE